MVFKTFNELKEIGLHQKKVFSIPCHKCGKFYSWKWKKKGNRFFGFFCTKCKTINSAEETTTRILNKYGKK